MAGDMPDFLEATQASYEDGWTRAERRALGMLWREHNRYAGYGLRWAAIALIEAAQKIAAKDTVGGTP